MENSGLCKDFPLSPPSSQHTEPQLLFPSLPDFSEETLHFFFISPLLFHNNLSASTHLCNGFSKCSDLFTNAQSFLKYLLLLFHLSLFVGFERQHQIRSDQSLSCVWLFATPWIAACQASLSITNSRSLPKLISIESVMLSSHLILCHPLLLQPSIFPSIRVFANESTLRIKWPKYWSFSSASVLPMNTQDWSPLGWTGWISLQSKRLSGVFSNTTVQKHQFFGAQLSL